MSQTSLFSQPVMPSAPGSGGLDSIGAGRGKFHCVNIPLLDGTRDQQYEMIFNRVATEVRHSFSPEAVVMQCGADLLSGDPIGSFSLTTHGVGMCVATILQWSLPTLLLGGGERAPGSVEFSA